VLALRALHPFPTRRSSDLGLDGVASERHQVSAEVLEESSTWQSPSGSRVDVLIAPLRITYSELCRLPSRNRNSLRASGRRRLMRSEEHTSELQSRENLVCS